MNDELVPPKSAGFDRVFDARRQFVGHLARARSYGGRATARPLQRTPAAVAGSYSIFSSRLESLDWMMAATALLLKLEGASGSRSLYVFSHTCGGAGPRSATRVANTLDAMLSCRGWVVAVLGEGDADRRGSAAENGGAAIAAATNRDARLQREHVVCC